MAHKEDLRITKTKAALTKAFFSMLNDMAFEDITVNELCDRADVRRATFYKHFKDKGDFTAYLIKDVRFRFETEQWNNHENTTLTAEYDLEYAKNIIHYIVIKSRIHFRKHVFAYNSRSNNKHPYKYNNNPS